MCWADVCATHPDQWLLIEALEAHTEDHKRVIDYMAVVEVCADGATALRRYQELHRSHPGRELYFVHTGNAELTIEERPWTGIRRNDASHAV
jgi:hypothetical protein